MKKTNASPKTENRKPKTAGTLAQSAISRRRFVKGSVATAAAIGLARFGGISAQSYANIVGANEDIRIGVVGFRSRGQEHINAYRKITGCRIVALCDVDKDVLHKTAEKLAGGISEKKHKDKAKTKTPSPSPTSGPSTKPEEDAAPALKPVKALLFSDVRKLLDCKEVDAISVATPNHWHSLIGIWACQAGKDAYVEKPISHNIFEGRKLVEAAAKYGRVIACGTQSRSSLALKEAFEFVRGGQLGKVLVARGLCYKRRKSIGKVEGEQPIPAEVDYNLWSGPREMTPLTRTNLHYDWHWVWPTGNGDLGNQGVHQMDMARLALGDPGLPKTAFSIGGRFGYVDDGTTPNTQMIVLGYENAQLIFEVRGLPAKANSETMDKLKGQGVGVIVECEGGYLSGTNAYDAEGKLVKTFESKANFTQAHFQNYIDAVRSGKPDHLHAPAETGHLSAACCHVGNISYRLGLTTDQDAIREAAKADKATAETLARFEAHLDANEVDLKKTQATLGAMLKIDPAAERFVDNEKANALLKDTYRAPFVVPDQV